MALRGVYYFTGSLDDPELTIVLLLWSTPVLWPGSLRHRAGLVHHLQLPLLPRLHPGVRRGPLLHQGGLPVLTRA